MNETKYALSPYRSVEITARELPLFSREDSLHIKMLVEAIKPRLHLAKSYPFPALTINDVTDYLLVVKQRPTQIAFDVDIIGVACFKVEKRPTETVVTFYGIAMIGSGWFDGGDFDAHESLCIDLLLQRKAQDYLERYRSPHDGRQACRIIDVSMPAKEES